MEEHFRWRAFRESSLVRSRCFADTGRMRCGFWGPVFSQVDRDQDLGRVRVDNLARYLSGTQKP